MTFQSSIFLCFYKNANIRKTVPLAICLVGLLCFVGGLAVGNIVFEHRVASSSIIKTTGVNVFWDQNCTEQVAEIKWGILEPNSSTIETVYVKSTTSNVAITVTIFTENWNPTNCTDYMTFTASPNDFVLNPEESKVVDLTLIISDDIKGIKNFSFTIVFSGVG